MKYKNIALISLVYGILSIMFSFREVLVKSQDGISSTVVTVSIFSLIFYSIILIKFRDLIVSRFKSELIDNIILIFIGGNILITLAGIIMWAYKDQMAEAGRVKSYGVPFIIIILFMGIINIIYSNRLKKIENVGKIKTYANIELVGGIATLSVIGITLAEILSGLSFIILYFIFREEERLGIKGCTLEKKKIENKTREKKVEILKAKPSSVEEYYNSLSLEEYNRIKRLVLAYLPKNLNEEEKEKVIKQYILREIIGDKK